MKQPWPKQVAFPKFLWKSSWGAAKKGGQKMTCIDMLKKDMGLETFEEFKSLMQSRNIGQMSSGHKLYFLGPQPDEWIELYGNSASRLKGNCHLILVHPPARHSVFPLISSTAFIDQSYKI